jgi:hypothetical protein
MMKVSTICPKALINSQAGGLVSSGIAGGLTSAKGSTNVEGHRSKLSCGKFKRLTGTEGPTNVEGHR